MPQTPDPYHPPGAPSAPAEEGQDFPTELRSGRYVYSDDLKARLARMGAMGFDFVIAILVLGAIGWAIDKYARGGGYAFTIAGVSLGVVVGTYRFIKDALAANRAMTRPGAPKPPSQ